MLALAAWSAANRPFDFCQTFDLLLRSTLLSLLVALAAMDHLVLCRDKPNLGMTRIARDKESACDLGNTLQHHY